MTIESPPLYIQADTYPARLDRFPLAMMYDEGVLDPTACKVTQRGAGANFSVDIAIGSFVIQGDDQSLQGNYLGRVTATENAAIGAAPGSNSRYDLVTLRVNDPNAGGNAGSNVTAVVVAGTASASPSVPALPASSIALAVVGPIATGTASITNAIINDVWTAAGPAFAASCRRLAGPKAPVAEMRLYAARPDFLNGWMYCNGAAVSRSTFASLFAIVGTLYGVGDGSTTFNLPDLRDRVPVGAGFTFTTLGATGGEVTHVLSTGEMPVHAHTLTDPGHLHTTTKNNDISGPTGSGTTVPSTSVADNTGSSTTGITMANAGSGGAHNNMQPYQVVSGWAIRY